mmetsp:Transcript_6556/g.17810  ORF Transcript_6556/g.17810 Transcript_6556/m.17810 type:complete len:254 (-) Transcript_6556:77-838(-)
MFRVLGRLHRHSRDSCIVQRLPEIIAILVAVLIDVIDRMVGVLVDSFVPHRRGTGWNFRVHRGCHTHAHIAFAGVVIKLNNFDVSRYIRRDVIMSGEVCFVKRMTNPDAAWFLIAHQSSDGDGRGMRPVLVICEVGAGLVVQKVGAGFIDRVDCLDRHISLGWLLILFISPSPIIAVIVVHGISVGIRIRVCVIHVSTVVLFVTLAVHGIVFIENLQATAVLEEDQHVALLDDILASEEDALRIQEISIRKRT